MKYNLANDKEAEEALARLYGLIEKRKVAEIIAVSPSRSLNQNKYLHVLLGGFGLHFGYTLEEAKLIYKEVNKDLYYYKKKNREFVKSSASLTKEEMTQSIDRFRTESAKAGCDLPPATNKEWLMQIENEIERGRVNL